MNIVVTKSKRMYPHPYLVTATVSARRRREIIAQYPTQESFDARFAL